MSFTLITAYDTPSIFTYDNTLIDIIASSKLKLKTYANETFFASFTSSIDANRAAAIKTGTAFNGAAIAAGLLNLKGGTNKYVEYSAASNFDVLGPSGCVRLEVKPNYSGTPGTDQHFFMATKASGDATNLVNIRHKTGTGNLEIEYRNSAGGLALHNVGAWVPVAGTTYEIEIDFDFATGATRCFIDGTQVGATLATVMTRTSDIAYVTVGTDVSGAGTPDFELDNVRAYSLPQHTANYVPDTNYLTYDNTYPSVVPKTLQGISAIASLATSETVPAGAYLLYYVIFPTTSDKLWHNGAAWVVSNGTSAQSNTSAQLIANIGSLDVSASGSFGIAALLGSDGYETPELVSTTLKYTFFNVAETITKCLVHFELYDSSGNPLEGAEVRFDTEDFWYVEGLISAPVTAKTDVDGKGSIELVETATSGKTVGIIISHASMPPIRYEGKTIPNKEVESLANIVA